MKWPAASLVALALAQACLLPGESQAPTERVVYGKANSKSTDLAVGAGDRFSGGQSTPVGLGMSDRDLQSILNVGEVDSGLHALARAFKAVTIFPAPHRTFEDRIVYGLVIGRPRVFLLGGIHGRERGVPDSLVYFLSDLLTARAWGAGLSYGGQNYTNVQVNAALSAGIVAVPLANPDGAAHDHATRSCWRKNRNARVSEGRGHPTATGVDLNRNFAVMWDYKRIFHEAADLRFAASDQAASEVFHGTAPLSEPESQNVDWVFERQGGLSWFLDLHSNKGDIFYAWGDDDYQVDDAGQNFANRTYDGKRGFLAQEGERVPYREYIDPRDLVAQQSVVSAMRTAMERAGSVRYMASPHSSRYVTSGTSAEHAFGRDKAGSCAAKRVHGLTMEFGRHSESPFCPFYPDKDAYHENLRQVAVGLMELLLAVAAEDGGA
ncbi:hypothetical protein DCS_03236 [Drechmeria coniospora]|uniref:Peptidase M14 domain-containing protein n=1 Tax=Drechmeria coniospora TaxID=98403 RepID=A0A151GYD2_DRECN|nr:hypothetical protein DCS_03236 [Drechmeria coniospora]KYK62091.1 hypothetical protein DCS_03236 [Drechmeria coniospora]